MSDQPDADAFVRGILREPADRVRRLVFADWLEERGRPPDIAWAEYLRLQAEMEVLPVGDSAVAELRERADTRRPVIRARLTLPARSVRWRFFHLLRLLPSERIRIRLVGADLSPYFGDWDLESVSHECRLIPVGIEDDTVAFASPHAPHLDIASKLAFVINRRVIVFHADENEVGRAVFEFFRDRPTAPFRDRRFVFESTGPIDFGDFV